MGLWYESDGVTQLPIEGGDKVRYFLLVKSPLNSKRSDEYILHYATEHWKPFGLPLKATYDDYGGIENIQEDIFSDYLLECIKKIAIEVPDRIGEPLNVKEMGWKDVIQRISSEGLKISDPFHISKHRALLNEIEENLKLLETDVFKKAKKKIDAVEEIPGISTMYFMMVREDIYQALISTKINEDYWDDGGWYGAKLKNEAKEYIKSIRKNVEEDKKLPLSLGGFGAQNKFENAFNYIDDSSYSRKYLDKYTEFVQNKIINGAPDNDPEIMNLTDQVIDMFNFSKAFYHLRKTWQPQRETGQHTNYEIHKKLAQITIKICNKKIQEQDD